MNEDIYNLPQEAWVQEAAEHNAKVFEELCAPPSVIEKPATASDISE